MAYEKENILEDEFQKKLKLVKKTFHDSLYHRNPEIMNRFDFNHVIIDFDALMSLVIQLDLREFDKKGKKALEYDLMSEFAYFVEKQTFGAKVTVIVNLKSYDRFNEIYPDWAKERQERYRNEGTRRWIDEFFMERLRKLSHVSKLFDLIETEEPPVIEAYKLIQHSDEKFMCYSRDPHFACILPYKDIHIFNGLDIVCRNMIPSYPKYPAPDASLLPHLFMIRGMTRNGYNGIRGYANKTTVKYIKEHLKTIIDLSDPIFDSVYEMRKIFFLNEIV